MLRRFAILIVLTTLLSACGFHAQGELVLAPPLHRLYLKTSDPYGRLARDLKEYLKASNVQLVSSPQEAETILTIMHELDSQELLSVSGTQQTRQYNLMTTVTFDISNNKGMVFIDNQKLSETRTITVQSNQILGSTNEANLFYEQMRRALAYDIMNRLASRQVTEAIMSTPYVKTKHKKR